MVTTRIITPLSVSSLNDQVTSTPPATIQLTSGITCGSALARISRKRSTPSTADSKRAPHVTSCAPRSPITRPKKPAITAATRGRKTTAAAKRSTLHHIDVFDRDRAAIAEIDDENGETDRRLGRRDRQHEHGEGLADEIAEEHRERHEVDADRKQHQLDGHQHDDDVFAIEEDTENPE